MRPGVPAFAVLLVAACGKSSSPAATCQEAIAPLAKHLFVKPDDPIMAELRKRCDAGTWPAGLASCVVDTAGDMHGFDKCSRPFKAFWKEAMDAVPPPVLVDAAVPAAPPVDAAPAPATTPREACQSMSTKLATAVVAGLIPDAPLDKQMRWTGRFTSVLLEGCVAGDWGVRLAACKDSPCVKQLSDALTAELTPRLDPLFEELAAEP